MQELQDFNGATISEDGFNMKRIKPPFSAGAVKNYEKDGRVALVLALEMVMSKCTRAHHCERHKWV